jgi:tetratricopeptide (TPR) repeat protein
MLEAARLHARAATWSGTRDPTQALRHWRKVRELADTLPKTEETLALRLEARIAWLNLSWRLGGSHEEAETLFKEAERLASDAGDIRSRAYLLTAYGSIMGLQQGDAREYARLVRQGVALAEESGDRALYVGVATSSFALLGTGEYREGAAICDRAIELAAGDPTVGSGGPVTSPFAFCHTLKGLHLGYLGELEAARGLLEQGRKLSAEQGDIEAVGWSHMWSSWLGYFDGEAESAVGHVRQSLEIAERIGGSFKRAMAWFHVGDTERLRGNWRQAIEALERSLAIAREHRHAEHESWRLALLGESYASIGDSDRARSLVAEALEMAQERGHVSEETHANLALARVLQSSGGLAARAEIEAALARTLELAQNTGARAFEPLVRVERAELARQSGDEEGRERELREAHRLFIQIGATGHAERLSAELATVS